MSTIIKILTYSVTSFAFHQACSKVVPAIARYAMDQTTPDDKKRRVIHSLCKPLSDSLLSNQDWLSSGAALCLKTLVDCDNWRFASSQMVNEVCQRVVGALEKCGTTNSHMGLVMSLAEHDRLIVEAYARLLVKSGIKIMNVAGFEGNSQKRMMAIQMINFLMKCLDYKCLFSELGFIIEEMKKCDDDQMAYVKGAAFEATQTAKRILTEKGSEYENQSGQRGRIALPESLTMGSFDGFTSMVDSPFASSGFSQEVDFDQSENGGVIENSKDQGDCANGFSRILKKCDSRSVTPSPKRCWSYINLDNVKIFTSPRNLVKCLQASNEVHSKNQSQRVKSQQSQSFTSPWLPKFDLNCTSKFDQNGFSCDLSDGFTQDDDQFYDALDLIPETEDICQQLILETSATDWLSAVTIFIVFFAIGVCFLLVEYANEDYDLVPT